MNMFNQSIGTTHTSGTDTVPVQYSSLYLNNSNYQLNMSDNVYLEYITSPYL